MAATHSVKPGMKPWPAEMGTTARRAPARRAAAPGPASAACAATPSSPQPVTRRRLLLELPQPLAEPAHVVLREPRHELSASERSSRSHSAAIAARTSAAAARASARSRRG